MFQFHRVDQSVIDPFEANRLVFANLRNVVTCVVNIGITEHEQRTHPRIRNQLQRRLKDDDTAAFRSHQRACDVKSVLWQQLI